MQAKTFLTLPIADNSIQNQDASIYMTNSLLVHSAKLYHLSSLRTGVDHRSRAFLGVKLRLEQLPQVHQSVTSPLDSASSLSLLLSL